MICVEMDGTMPTVEVLLDAVVSGVVGCDELDSNDTIPDELRRRYDAGIAAIS